MLVASSLMLLLKKNLEIAVVNSVVIALISPSLCIFVFIEALDFKSIQNK